MSIEAEPDGWAFLLNAPALAALIALVVARSPVASEAALPRPTV